jgi:CubicO group peptidase (beta-lactamase class C family)
MREELDVEKTVIGGYVEPGFGAVADAFQRNFAQHGELGAAFAAHHEGRKVVDIWGGVADRDTGASWQEDTLQLIFSGTKGLTAGCVLLLVDDGLLDPDAYVSVYWPEFSARGKTEITVADVLSHRAGLAAPTTPVTCTEALDGVRMAALLADQSPHWAEDTRLAYHARTFGWLCDALVRRIANMSTGQFFRQRICERLNLEAWIGLPVAYEARVSRLDASDFEALDETGYEPDYARLIYGNPPLFGPPISWNEHAFHAGEFPSSNGIVTARAMAEYYACLAGGGELNGVRLWSEEAVLAARAERVRGVDPYTGEPHAFGLGFALQTEQMYFGPVRNAFGHCGAGGSAHGAWPRQRVGFSYCMNAMRDERSDHRARRLLTALAEAVDA